jgi:hypothetical protein
MKKTAMILSTITLLSGCGIDVKTPKEMDFKVDLDAKSLLKQIRQGTTNKIPPQYQKFLKADELKKYLRDTAKNIQGECLIPTRAMTEGEQQGDMYVFLIHQKCYIHQADRNRTLRVEFDITGYLNTTDLKHEFVLEEHPDAQLHEVPFEEYEALRAQGRFISVVDQG